MAKFIAGFSSLGSAAGDLFASKGYKQQAKGFQKAAALSRETAVLAGVAGEIQAVRTKREAYKVIGGQKADVAGAGFAASGSALDLLRGSTAEAALDLALTATQTSITVKGYEAEAESYKAQGEAAASQGKSSFISGVFKAAVGIGSLFLSDRRFKRDIKRIGFATNGLSIYSYRYAWGWKTRIGFIAQQVAARNPHAVVKLFGVLFVNYKEATRG